MDEHLGAETPDEIADTTVTIIEETSTEYLGRWNRLISTTNWEKGRIISEWRQRLVESDAPGQTCSDEAWSRRVGNVSGQHAGRLRRVWDRFGQGFEQFEGLYWSHFQAAVDWDDAEMYLEGAVQSTWSVSEMRAQRCEAMGSAVGGEAVEEDIAADQFDEDADPVDDDGLANLAEEAELSGEFDEADDSDSESQDVSDDPPFDEAAEANDDPDSVEPTAPVRPFEDLTQLPDDLKDAFEALKIAIISHRLTEWQEASLDDVLAHLDAMKVLATTEK